MTGDDRGPGAGDQLLARFAGLAARFDPVPAEVLRAARESFTWRTVGSELAALVYDSDVDDDRLVGVRSGSSARHLTFEGPQLTVEMEIDTAGGRLVGQLVPPRPANLEVRHQDGSVDAQADERGCFVVEGLPSGPMSLLCRSPGDAGVPGTTTDWVAI